MTMVILYKDKLYVKPRKNVIQVLVRKVELYLCGTLRKGNLEFRTRNSAKFAKKSPNFDNFGLKIHKNFSPLYG